MSDRRLSSDCGTTTYDEGGMVASERDVMAVAVPAASAVAAEEDRDDLRSRLEQRLVLQLAAYLGRCPDMGEELAVLPPAPQDDAPSEGALVLTAQNNTDSQIVQAPGNLDAGSGGIDYGVPPRNPRA
ncbi:hypothetical protein [Streptomyces termitum]|uniref:hypothetical protein n=1 Tax=Streptomyces termitum TaxID=67368 RepID=UPI0037A3B4C9